MTTQEVAVSKNRVGHLEQGARLLLDVQAERDRYRKALKQITTAFCDAPSAADMRDIARAALAPEAR